MNILFSLPTNVMTLGIFNAIKDIFPHIFWNPQQSIYSILDNNSKPDILFCENKFLNNNVIDAIQEFNIPTVSLGMCENFPQLKLICSTTNIPEKIKNNIGIETYLISYAANLLPKSKNKPIPGLVIINNDGLEVLDYIQAFQDTIPFRIFGKVKLPIPEYLGNISLDETIEIIRNSTDLLLTGPEHIYDVAVNKKFCLCTYPNELYPYVQEPKNVKYWLDTIYKDNSIKQNMIDKAYIKAKNKTYYHQASEILAILHHYEESIQCLSKLSKILE